MFTTGRFDDDFRFKRNGSSQVSSYDSMCVCVCVCVVIVDIVNLIHCGALLGHNLTEAITFYPTYAISCFQRHTKIKI